jgi:hypothetical protein
MPFELFYGTKPDYHILRDSSGACGQFDMHLSAGIALGRSNHTNTMIFWDPVTQRMYVLADSKLDPNITIVIHFSTVVSEGQISHMVLQGGEKL